ncbi:hypothetical protein PAXRUDRAFT_161202 [Paxillus rubicundulus Ve08.2h10]|uniref:Uncharacterized protein n=1 Tax=Paxillus rubicundulus Ve08.2h10 TaxID=930991 RepID=A0A0D0C9D9_9AGAM|nr:hypothetical protein PAXRUDRAFT_161202 [Paxillus rubicundulus Ve08.2h10]
MWKHKAKDANLPVSLHPPKCTTTNKHTEQDSSRNAEGDSSSDEESDDERGGILMVNPPSAQLTTQSPSGTEALSAGWTQGQNGHSCKWRKNEVNPWIDYLINAKNHSVVMCQRKVFDVCFYNDTASSDHLECNTDNADGFLHCNIGAMQPPVCCNIHASAEFPPYTSDVPKPPTIPQCSRIPQYTKGKHNFDLVNTLNDWQEAKTTTIFGWASLNNHGPSLIMPNTTLDHIVNCTHHHKIHTAQDLKQETGWMDTEHFGMEVMAIIQRHALPLPSPFVSMPLRPTSSNNISITSHLRPPTPSSPISHMIHLLNIPKWHNKCSACGHEGHNAHNRICVQHPSQTSASEKENVSHSHSLLYPRLTASVDQHTLQHLMS